MSRPMWWGPSIEASTKPHPCSAWTVHLMCSAWSRLPGGLGTCGGTGVSRVLLPLWNDGRGLQKVIQCLNIKLNDFPLHSIVLWCTVIWVIGILIKVPHQSNVDPLLWEAYKPSLPLSPLELPIELVVHSGVSSTFLSERMFWRWKLSWYLCQVISKVNQEESHVGSPSWGWLGTARHFL